MPNITTNHAITYTNNFLKVWLVWLPIKSHFQEKVINADYVTIWLQKRILIDDAFTIARANQRQVKILALALDKHKRKKETTKNPLPQVSEML